MYFNKFLIIVFCFFTPTYAYAYLDPGTGSIIIQAILAFFAAIGATCSLYWLKIKNFFKKKDIEKENIDENK